MKITFVRVSSAEENSEDCNEEKIDIEELEVSQVTINRIENHDRNELSKRICCHVLEDTEAGYESCTTFPDDGGNTRNVWVL